VNYLIRLFILICSYAYSPVDLFAQNTAIKFPSKDSIIIPATTTYKSNKFQKIVYGNQYRKAWSMPVKVPVFDMQKTFSGLVPVKKGGGMSTKSLRLEAANGRAYVLRSVYKNGRAGVPERFKETVYEDILQDLRVGAHPYGALPIPTLAEAAGIYHTNPKIYYLPKQEGLGTYSELFGGELYLFEEYPNEGWESLKSFGYAKKIIGYDTMLKKIKKSAKHRIDEKWVLKSRLFDLWIGDYDRHDDQWRWAVFSDTTTNTIKYRPIPRDRDQAFYDIRGVLPWVLSRDFLNIQQRPFKSKIQNLKGFLANAIHFDRTWMTELDWADWEKVAIELQASITDEVIEQAFTIWSPEIYALNGPYLVEKLKSRRNNMVKQAKELYTFLSQYVDVVGTNKKEYFDVEKKTNGEVIVKIYADKKDDTPFYKRKFLAKETKEIRLYGLEGVDEFKIYGAEKNPILIRIIGGEGLDEIQRDKVNFKGKKIVVYDTIGGINLPSQNGISNQISKKKEVNDYNRKEFKLHSYLPLIVFGSTTDDGFFFGGGVNFTRYGFRKNPYRSKHHIFMNLSTQTDALHFKYEADFTEAIGQFSFNPNITFDRPIIFNFYGFGNNTLVKRLDNNAEDERFHWVRLKRFKIEPLLKRTSKNRNHSTLFGPFYQNVIVQQRFDRISSEPSFFNEDTYLGNKDFVGFLVKHQYDSVDDLALESGWNYTVAWTYYRNLGRKRGYGRLEGNVTHFSHFEVPFVMALGSRIGFSTLTNDNYYFFHNNNLGGHNYLRGFHNNRYAGTSMAYWNVDLRVPLFYFKNSIAPGEVGLLAGFDTGRVWYSAANDGGWKTGFSSGLWWTPYKFTAINFFYTLTNKSEVNTFTLRTGFTF